MLDLLQKLHSEQPFGYVFVSHDIGLLQAVTDRIIVMKDGQIVETIESKRLKKRYTHIQNHLWKRVGKEPLCFGIGALNYLS